MNGVEITDAMIEAAADAYEEGVQPGEEYFGDRAEIRYMAEKVLRAGLAAFGEEDSADA